MKRRSLLIGLIVVVFLALVVVATLPRRAPAGVVRVGSVLVLSGDYKSLGEQIRDGQMLALEEINAEPGRRYKLELMVYDSQGEKEIAKDKVKTLYRDGVRFIAEIFGSGPALDCIPFITQQNMLFVSGVDTGPDLTTKGGRNFFRIIPSDAVASQQLARLAVDLGLRKAAVVYLNDTWGTGLKNELERVYPRAGGEIVLSLDTAKGQDIFGPVVTALREKQPEAVFLFIHPREAALLLKEARSQRFDARFLGTDNLTGTELVELGRAAVDGVLFVVPSPAQQSERTAHFRQLYEKKFGAGKEPPLFSVMGYDAMHLVGKVIEESGAEVDRAIEILQGIKYMGASGPISFDRNHDILVQDYQRKIYTKTARGVVALPFTASARTAP